MKGRALAVDISFSLLGIGVVSVVLALLLSKGLDMLPILYLGFFCFIFGFFLIIILLFLGSSEAGEKAVEVKAEADRWPEKHGIPSAKILTVKTDLGASSPTSSVRVVVDTEHQMLYFLYLSTKLSGPDQLPFDKILGCSVVEDGAVSGQIGRAMVGGLIGGVAGAMVGAGTAKKRVKSYQFVIQTNDIANPTFTLDLIKGDAATDIDPYTQCTAFAAQLTATITAIIAQNQTMKATATESQDGTGQPPPEQSSEVPIHSDAVEDDTAASKSNSKDRTLPFVAIACALAAVAIFAFYTISTRRLNDAVTSIMTEQIISDCQTKVSRDIGDAEFSVSMDSISCTEMKWTGHANVYISSESFGTLPSDAQFSLLCEWTWPLETVYGALSSSQLGGDYYGTAKITTDVFVLSGGETYTIVLVSGSPQMQKGVLK